VSSFSFTSGDDDDLFASVKPAKKIEPKAPVDDIFNTSKPSKSSKLGDDLFSDDYIGSKSSSSLFSDTNKKSKKPKLFDDDLFADIDIKPDVGRKKKSTPVENVSKEFCLNNIFVLTIENKTDQLPDPFLNV